MYFTIIYPMFFLYGKINRNYLIMWFNNAMFLIIL